jgi:D-alanyl-D-alanine carboxypeptidase
VSIAMLASACSANVTGSPSSLTRHAEPGYAATLRPKLQQIFADTLTPGAVVLVRSPELGDWAATFGTRTRGGRVPVTLADHVRIGSNTKTWTGTVILQLVQEGKLRLDEPVSRYRPDVPNGQNITITHLLDMRSGLYNYSESLELNQTIDTNPTKVWTPDELLGIAYKYPPYFLPGQGYHYSNTNTVLLGLIIEKLTGNPVEHEFQTRIFTPLGLRNTQFPRRTSNALPTPFPNGYQFGTNVATMASQMLPVDQQAAARAGTLKPFDCTHDNPSWGWTAGAGISTAGDLARYVQALVGGGLLNDAMQKQRLASIRPTNPDIDPDDPRNPGYGLALARFGPVYGHTGELPGYNTFMGYDPQRKIAIVVWSSLAAAPDGQAPAVEMAKVIIGHLYGGQVR